jgi:Ca2+-binding EF-hand superfamily protein
MGSKMSKDQLRTFFKFLDVDKNGKITFDEIYSRTLSMAGQQKSE